jgi:hypothetical protein
MSLLGKRDLHKKQVFKTLITNVWKVHTFILIFYFSSKANNELQSLTYTAVNIALLKRPIFKDVPDHINRSIDRSIDRSKSLVRLIDRSTSKLRSVISFILKAIK